MKYSLASGRRGATCRRVQSAVLRWYKTNARDFPWRQRYSGTYRRVVVEILLQRTRAERVSNAYHAFFGRFPDWYSLATASNFHLRSSLRSLGLWKRRAVTLHALAAEMVQRGGRFPSSAKALALLPGVGQYVVNAILLQQSRIAAPLIDSSMARVVERVFSVRRGIDIRRDRDLQRASWDLVQSARALDLNWALLDLAAKVCTPRDPRCEVCPIRSDCASAGRRRS